MRILPVLLIGSLAASRGYGAVISGLGGFTCNVPTNTPGSPGVGTQVCGPNYLESHAPSPTNDVLGAIGGASSLIYNFEVLDSSNRLVTADLSFFLLAQATGGDSFSIFGRSSHQAEASIQVTTAALTFSEELVATADTTKPVVSLGGQLQAETLQVNTNQEYNITLRTSAATEGVGDAYAFASTQVAVDASLYPDASVVVSPGISNTLGLENVHAITPVPLPGTGWLLGVSLLGLAAYFRPNRGSLTLLTQ